MQKQLSTASPDVLSAKLPSRSRAERRREDTRRRLMKATYEIIARRGFEGLVIQDITGVADLGYGTFYNHFISKDAIVAAVIDAARSHMKAMYARTAGKPADRVQAFATDLRRWLHLSRTDQLWGWFIIRTVLSGEELRSVIGDVLKRAVHAGIEEGAFKHDDIEMAHEIVGGLLLLGTLKLVSAEVSGDYADKLVSASLKTLGVSSQKIKEVMSKPFRPFDMPAFLESAM